MSYPHRGFAGPVAGVVPALFSRVVMARRLAEPAGTDCRGEGGPVLIPLHSPGLLCHRLRCRGLRCRLLRLGHGTGQFLAADPDSEDPDEQGEQRDPGGNHEPGQGNPPQIAARSLESGDDLSPSRRET